MEDRPMARRSKREYLKSIYERYRQSSRAEKQTILDEFMQVCGCHRKYAIWAAEPAAPSGGGRGGFPSGVPYTVSGD